MFNYNRNLKKQSFFSVLLIDYNVRFIYFANMTIYGTIFICHFNFNLTQVNILIIFIINF